MTKLEALRAAVESRNWLLVELALASAEKSLSDALGPSKGPSEPETPYKFNIRDRVKYQGLGLGGAGIVVHRYTTGTQGVPMYEVDWDSGYRAVHPEEYLRLVPTCPHWNDRYGYCILNKDHELVPNGVGVLYRHKYISQGSLGSLDVREAEPRKDWTTFDECGYCHAEKGSPCRFVFTVWAGKKMHAPHLGRKLISQNVDGESEKKREVDQSPPPVPTRTHISPATCSNCHPPQDCTRGEGCACCKINCKINKPQGTEACPSPCDGDCDAPCHESHQPQHKQVHPPESCGVLTPRPDPKIDLNTIIGGPRCEDRFNDKIMEKDPCPRCGKDLSAGGEKGHWAASKELPSYPVVWCEPDNQQILTEEEVAEDLGITLPPKKPTWTEHIPGCPCPPCTTQAKIGNPQVKLCPSCKGRWYMSPTGECNDTFHLFRPSDER